MQITLTFARTLALFIATGIAEILGCYLVYLHLKHQRSPLLWIPAMLSLTIFAWLLSLHPTAAARTYAAYGGVYICVALMWLWAVEGQRPDLWDLMGCLLCLAGMTVIAFGPKH